GRLGRDHLLAAVETVSSDVVTQMHFTGGRIGGQLLCAQGVVRTTHAAAGRGNTGFLHSHGIAPNSVRLLRRLIARDASVQHYSRFRRDRRRSPAAIVSSAPPMPRTDWPCVVPPRLRARSEERRAGGAGG